VADDIEVALNSFQTIGLTEFSSCVVPVLVDDGEEKIRLAGTAFNIHPHGLWVTARHVIDDAFSKHRDARVYLLWADPEETHPGPPPWLDGEEVPDGPHRSGLFVSVAYFCTDDANGSDLALLRAGMFNNGEPHMFPVARLSARIPKIGTPVLAMGYAKSGVKEDTETSTVRKIAIAHGLSVSTGKVIEVHREGRDTFRDLDGRPTGYLSTACFDTSARFDCGMSGGTVLDGNAAVCGIISKGGAYDDRSIATATPLLFTLGVPHDDEDPDVSTVYQLAEAGVIEVDEYFQQLDIAYDENGQGTIRYPCEDDQPTDSGGAA
jgi:Trypsin-like peptidase domain